MNISLHLCEDPFPFAGSALATPWCHWWDTRPTWDNQQSFPTHLLIARGEPLAHPSLIHSFLSWMVLEAAPGVKAIPHLWGSWLPISELFPILSYLWWGQMCPLLSNTSIMWYQHYLCSCETNLASSISQRRPDLLLLPHSSSSFFCPPATLLYLRMGRGRCTCIPAPVTSSDGAHHLCSWEPECSWAVWHPPGPAEVGALGTLAGMDGCATTAAPAKDLAPGAGPFPAKLGNLGEMGKFKGGGVLQRNPLPWKTLSPSSKV